MEWQQAGVLGEVQDAYYRALDVYHADPIWIDISASES